MKGNGMIGDNGNWKSQGVKGYKATYYIIYDILMFYFFLRFFMKIRNQNPLSNITV